MAKRGRPEEQGVTLDYLQQLHDKHEAWLHRREFRNISNLVPNFLAVCSVYFIQSA